MTTPRVLIIGLDGASPSFFQHWAGEGLLPFMQDAFEGGASGVLRSTIPPYTPTAWTSMVTGVNPGRHGVFGFTRWTDEGREVLVDSSVSRSKPLWELLSEQERPSVVINVPVTYPPRPLRGVLVSGMGTPSGARNYTYPEDVQGLITSVAPDYRTDVLVADRASRSKHASMASLRRIESSLADRLRVAEDLLVRFPWEFSMVVFEAPDRLQHLFWRLIEPGRPPSPGRQAVLDVYRRLDEGLGLLIRRVQAEGPVVVLIVSDHGFQGLDWFLSLNLYLRRHGLLELAHRSPLVWAALLMPAWARGVAGRVMTSRANEDALAPRTLSALDRKRSAAFSGQVFEQGVYVCPTGNQAGDRERRELVEATLRDLPSPLDDGPAIVDVLKKEDIYWGAATSAAPDLFPRFRVPGVMLVPRLESSRLWERVTAPYGTHHPDGMVVGLGPGIVHRGDLFADAQDIAPTVLKLLGGPLPEGLDGTPIEALGGGEVPEVPMRTDRAESSPTSYSAQEEEEIAEHLRGLGYLE
jgi:predicted AlkP superfamily phosphohydrolase/phosphomutase